MSKFQELSHYQTPLANGYKLLPLSFSELDTERYVLTNMVGEYHVLDKPTTKTFLQHGLSSSSPQYADLKSKHFLLDDDSSVAIDLLALKTKTRFERLSNFTGLHLFVVSLRCEHSCPYCQVSRQNDDRTDFDMTEETAESAIDLVFQSPSPHIKIEFQGGEPLLNFPRIAQIVKSAKARNEVAQRDLGFVIATNLAVVSDEVLEFCRVNGIEISTSLDGPKNLHNKNRPRPGGDSYERAVAGIDRVRAALGFDSVSAVMTTTNASLDRPREIVDEYLERGFRSVFLRPLSPYGFAVKTKWYNSYDTERWLKFYFDGLDYIIDLNKRGTPFKETYASLVLTKMLTPFQPGYVDLASPAGIGTGALLYNYDGAIFASDESRMLAEMGDTTFRLGTVADSYETLIGSDVLLDALEQSFAASAPMCSTCAYEPYCGADPVYHHATQGDYLGRKPLSGFCNRNMAIFKGLLTRMESDLETRRIFTRWANR